MSTKIKVFIAAGLAMAIISALALVSTFGLIAEAITTAHCDYLYVSGPGYAANPNSEWGATSLTAPYVSNGVIIQQVTMVGFHDTWNNPTHPDHALATFADGYQSTKIFTTNYDAVISNFSLYKTHGKITNLRACYRL